LEDVMKTSPRDGRYIDDEVARDGESVRVSIMTCDSIAGHRSGYVPLTDAQAAGRKRALDSRQEMIDAQREAWRGSKSTNLVDSRRKPPPDDDEDDDDDTADAADAARFAARESWVRSLSDAWRQPVKSQSRSPNFGNMTAIAHDAAEPDREAAYEKRKQDLQNAWRSPIGRMTPQRALTGIGPAGFIEATGDPDPAARQEAIRREGERTKGGG
jgi:hypothetical protein